MVTIITFVMVWLLGARYTYKLGNFLDRQECKEKGKPYEVSHYTDGENRTFSFWLWPLFIFGACIEYLSKFGKGKASDILFGPKPK